MKKDYKLKPSDIELLKKGSKFDRDRGGRLAIQGAGVGVGLKIIGDGDLAFGIPMTIACLALIYVLLYEN